MNTEAQLQTILADYKEHELPAECAIEAIKRVMGQQLSDQLLDLQKEAPLDMGLDAVADYYTISITNLALRYSHAHVIDDEHWDQVMAAEQEDL